MAALFAASVFEAANTSACRTRIVSVEKRTNVPLDVQSVPWVHLQEDSLCCHNGMPYSHWLSCQDFCSQQPRQPRQRAAWSYVTSDVLIEMRDVIVGPTVNARGLCGPITRDHRCVLNAMHWDSRAACSVVMNERARSHVDKLGLVLTVYAGAAGHFPQESVPTILRLLNALPKSVPIWIPDSAIARRYMKYIAQTLDEHPSRFVHLKGPISVNTLYLFRPDPKYSSPGRRRPLTVRSRDDFLRMRDALRSRTPPAARTVLLIRREHQRALVNNQAVEAALRRVAHAHGLEFEARDCGRGPLAGDVEAFHAAKVVVGVHGAGLANMVFCCEDTSVIEIGYTDGMRLPDIYFDQARFLKLPYWAVMGKGSYTGRVSVDLPTLEATVSRALRGGSAHVQLEFAVDSPSASF